MFGVKLGLATLAAFVALVAAVPAHASTPIPWCGTSSSRGRPPARRDVGIRRPRGLRQAGERTRPVPRVRAADRRRHRRVRQLVAPRGRDADAAVRSLPGPGLRDLVRRARHLERPAAARGQQTSAAPSRSSACGSSRARLQRGREGLPRLLRRPDRPGRRTTTSAGRERARAASTFPASRSSTSTPATPTVGDSLRPVVAMHELVHVFGAVERAAPNVVPERPRLRLRHSI